MRRSLSANGHGPGGIRCIALRVEPKGPSEVRGDEMALPCNVGGGDRLFRLLVGVGLLTIALFTDIALFWRVLAGAVATIAFLTAGFQYCPVNAVLKINTCRRA